MTALQLNAEMYRALGQIADDVNLMEKALKYVKKLAAKKVTKKHRLIYEIFETEVYVDVLSAYGHYDEK